MSSPRRILLLAGTAEARALAGRLYDMPHLHVIASLAGVTRDAPALPAAETRTGGFGGVDGLARFLRERKIDAVIDATHPFAATMPWNAHAACERTGKPRIRLLRPAWPARPGWIAVPSAEDAAARLPEGARAFLTTGRSGIAAFAERRDLRLLARSIEDPGPLPASVTPVLARPPFTCDSEVALMSSHRITHLVSKNAGGTGSAKLDAAERLGISVVMLERPAQPPGPVAEDVPGAVAWLRETVGFGS